MNFRHCYLHHKRDQLSRVHRCPKEGVIHHEIDAATLPKVDWSNKLLLFTAQLCKSPLNSRLLQAGFNPTNIKSTLFVDNADAKKNHNQKNDLTTTKFVEIQTFSQNILFLIVSCCNLGHGCIYPCLLRSELATSHMYFLNIWSISIWVYLHKNKVLKKRSFKLTGQGTR